MVFKLHCMSLRHMIYWLTHGPALAQCWVIKGAEAGEGLRGERQRFPRWWVNHTPPSAANAAGCWGWAGVQLGNGGWSGLAVCFLARAKGGSQLARPCSRLIGLRSLPVAPPAPSRRLPNQQGPAWAHTPLHAASRLLDIVTGPLGTVSSLPPSLSPSPIRFSLLLDYISQVLATATTLSLRSPKKIF